MKKFTEVQKYNRPWHWVVFGFIGLICIVPTVAVNLTEKDPLIGNITSITASIVFIAFWLSVRLETEISDEGISYRYRPFHRKPRKIKWEELAQVGIEKYNSFKEYGGWGLRQKPLDANDILLNVSGNMGIRIYHIDGRKLTIGTLKSEEVLELLKQRFSENTTNDIETKHEEK